ncbi:hypothetical protein OCU04_009020 [Sclerotinia nivalis]|uniref:Uncharacterized protein n=1 Tax=Sclerotinia nivalis TaxID=352851 RepID=A0A9X0DHB2_9HELO|nr:hypothetical protein OCU04_009020 [Sclerotinia nivalis]
MIASIMRTGKEAENFAESGLQNHLPDTGGRAKVFSRSTLVIVRSASLIDEWIEEINKHCHGHININTYHGRGRETDRDILADSDIVFSTYDTIALEAIDQESPVYCIKWFRIILDEAHRIRNTTTKLFRAMLSLSANLRWCLTGTPIQNSLEDLAALISFIGTFPLDDTSVFRKYITNPLLKGIEEGFDNLRALLNSICLRRTKLLLEDLPKVQNIHRPVYFSANEKSLYLSTQRELIHNAKQHDSQKRNQKGYFGAFQMLQQLRRLCNHGTFQKKVSGASDMGLQFDPGEAFVLVQVKDDAKCHYCRVEIVGLNPGVSGHGRFSSCGHLFCFACASTYKDTIEAYDKSSYIRCPICSRKIIGIDLFADDGASTRVLSSSGFPSVSEVFETTNGISSKISALLTDIKQNQTEGKSLIFSCWTTSLDLVGYHLSLHRLSFQRLDGNSSHSQRREILKEFVADSTKRILIMTTGTGAEGLNLMVANCVYILEPQWNPMVEEQAIARASRMGQTRDVKVFRYVMQGTLEEDMQSQQSRKLFFAKMV